MGWVDCAARVFYKLSRESELRVGDFDWVDSWDVYVFGLAGRSLRAVA